MNPSQIKIFIDGIKISLNKEKEKPIKPNYNQFYYAKPVEIKRKHKLNELFNKYIPECDGKLRNSYRARKYTISAEDAVISILKLEYPNIMVKFDVEYDGKKFYPDGAVIDFNNPQKPKYLFEIKTTSSRSTYDRRRECLIKVAGLQALRNSSALIMAGEVDSIFPKVVIAEYEYIPIEFLGKIKSIGDYVVIISDEFVGEKIPIIVKKITIYGVRVFDSFMLDKELASLLYKYLGG